MAMWMPVVGHENDYSVSSDGQVWSRPRSKTPGGFLRIIVPVNDYPTVGIHGRPSRIHRLMAEAFLGAPHGRLVRHLDDVKTNNELSNLAYGSRRDNAVDAIRNGRHAGRSSHCLRGHDKEGRNRCYACYREVYDPARKARAK